MSQSETSLKSYLSLTIIAGAQCHRLFELVFLNYSGGYAFIIFFLSEVSDWDILFHNHFQLTSPTLFVGK